MNGIKSKISQQNVRNHFIRRRNHSFAFSGCGWLSPFHLGVIHAMKQHGWISDKSIFGGTSGGSIAALIACLDVPPSDALELIIEMSLKEGVFRNIDQELRLSLNIALKRFMSNVSHDDILHRCNNRLYITTTQVDNLKPHLITQYSNIHQIIDAVSASCFIPIYSGRRLSTSISGYNSSFVDGGFRAFMPPVGDIRVSPFPVGYMKGVLSRYPHITLPAKDYFIPQLFLWAAVPASPQKLRKIYHDGIAAGEFYIQQKGQKTKV